MLLVVFVFTSAGKIPYGEVLLYIMVIFQTKNRVLLSCISVNNALTSTAGV